MKIAQTQKVFISYAWTGEDKEVVASRVRGLCTAFNNHQIDAYCNFDDPKVEGFTEPKQFIAAAIEELRTCDVVFVVQSSERRSEGQLIEVGAALATGKTVIIAQHSTAAGKSYLQNLAHYTFEWDSETSLIEQIEDLV